MALILTLTYLLIFLILIQTLFLSLLIITLFLNLITWGGFMHIGTQIDAHVAAQRLGEGTNWLSAKPLQSQMRAIVKMHFGSNCQKTSERMGEVANWLGTKQSQSQMRAIVSAMSVQCMQNLCNSQIDFQCKSQIAEGRQPMH